MIFFAIIKLPHPNLNVAGEVQAVQPEPFVDGEILPVLPAQLGTFGSIYKTLFVN